MDHSMGSANFISKQRSMIGIIGASFAGLSAYLTIKKHHPTQDVKLFDMRPNFTFIPSLHETLGSTKTLKRIQFPLSQVYEKDVMQEEIVHITPDGRITGRSGAQRQCEHLVIATGSRTNFGPNPSFERYGMTIRYPEDIPTLNKALENARNTTVIGGGYTGIEVASVLGTRKLGGHIRLIHREPSLLPHYHYSIGKTAERYLQRHGVDIHFTTNVTDMDAESITLDNGLTLPSDVTIVNTGIIINDEVHKPYLTFTGKNNTYAARENEKIFTCGDVAIHGLYTTAHNAYEEGKRVGQIIADKIAGKHKTYPPLTNYNKLALALGVDDGIFIINRSGRYLPYITGTIKRLIEKKIMREFMHKILLPF